MHRSQIVILFILCYLHQIGNGQNMQFCGSELFQNQELQDANFKQLLLNTELEYQRNGGKPNNTLRNIKINIPVVFHIIHNNGSENISDAQVSQGLEHLNQAFANEGPFFDVQGVDCEIQFCLAQRDMEGKAFSGITRNLSIYTDMANSGALNQIRNQFGFDENKYLNIYIVKNVCFGGNCALAGLGGTNLVIVRADFVGTSVNNEVVIIHEVAHALGLDHTWKGGCKNDNCLKDGDKVCDTPPDNRNFDGCSMTSNSCSTDEYDTSVNNPFRSIALGGQGGQNDDNTNYMDYNWYSCMSHFTQGQADRMHFIIQKWYADLLISDVCLPPCEDPVSAFFNLPNTILVGESLSISNQSFNADAYQWYVNGLPISTNTDFNYTFNELGNIKISLEAYSNDTLCTSHTYEKTIKVVCKVEACISYHISDQYLIFEDCSQNADDIEWIIYNGSGDKIYCTTLTLDSLYVNNIDFVRLCLSSLGEHCEDYTCEYITITSDGSEVCGNEEDDDGDGLIDLFDRDCPCEDGAYQAQCPTQCEIVPDSFPDIKMKMEWESEVLETYLASESRFIITKSQEKVEIISTQLWARYENLTFYLDSQKIVKINPHTGLITNDIPITSNGIIGGFCAGNPTKLNNYLYYTGEGIKIHALNENLINVFISDSLKAEMNTEIFISDIDNNGFPELFKDGIILNAINGKILCQLPKGGCNFGTNRCLSIPVIADFIDSPGLEVAMGNKVYEINLTNLADSIGNTYTEHQAPPEVTDGFTSVGDIDGDGKLDVIVVTDRDRDGGGIYVWNPRNSSLIASAEAGEDGGVAFVGDIDGDCNPEIGMTFKNELRMYKYDGTTILKLLWQISTSDRSGRTGVTMFDFNQDGKQELVYRDETYLRLIEGSFGNTIDSFYMVSPTGLEYPVIADIDNDGQAEILITGHENDKNLTRIYCFESASTPWAPARSVWNQYAYNPTQVNDDLTIPRYQQNAAQPLQGTENCPRETCNTPYNNFMVQATYRTQEGCYVWPDLQRDLSITASSKCLGDSLEICFYTTSTDTITIRNGVTVSCYPPPWDNGSDQLLDSITITSDTTCIMMPMLTGIDSIMIVINDSGYYYPPDFSNTDITECDYTNNEFVLHLGGPDFRIDIIDWECTPDSLIFYIATDNMGLDTDVSCIGGGCYFANPMFVDQVVGFVPPIEYTNWCFDYDSITMTYQYQDTFRVSIPHPMGQSIMWWTINEGGFGPGVLSSEVTGIYECNYNNNIDSVAFDISEKVLDLGPEIIKCNTEVFTLYAGSEFESYLWSDLTTDSIYSATNEGMHYVEATDQCGRVYRDTVVVVIDYSSDIDLGTDLSLCQAQSQSITLTGDYDQVHWMPSDKIDCDTCRTVQILADISFQLVAMGRKDNCVSYDTIEVSILPQILIKDTISICEGDAYTVQDSLLKTAGIYTFELNDCDSVYQLDLRVIPMLATKDTTMICQGDSIEFGGVWISEEGIYPFAFPTNLGCDSLVELTLMIEDVYTSSEEIYICEGDSVQIFGVWQKEEGEYSDVLQSFYGCDSTVVIELNHYPSYSFFDTIALCEGDSIEIGGQWIKEEGNTTIPLQSLYGCDSIYNVFLTFGNVFMKDEPITLCKGDSVLIDNVWVTEAGVYPVTYQNTTGCDSLITYKLSVQNINIFEDTLNLCQGDSIQINNKWINSAGLYVDTVPDGICYKISTTLIQELPTKTSKAQFTLCPSDSIQINGSWLKEAGEYEFMLMTEMGCDSILTAEIILLENPTPPDIFLDCDALEILAEISADNIWTITWDNGQEGEFAMYSSSGIGSVSLISPPDCEVVYEFDLPSIPSVPDFLQLKDTLVYTGSTLSYDLNLNEDDWIIEWVSPMESGCNYCSKANFSVFKPSSIVLNLEHIESGCTYTTTINVDVVRADILVPNVFSPNRDEINDTWEVDLSDYENPETMIFDRWGNLMYKSYSSYPMWRGIFNSKNVNPGVYVYVIKYGASSERKIQTGDITVIR